MALFGPFTDLSPPPIKAALVNALDAIQNALSASGPDLSGRGIMQVRTKATATSRASTPPGSATFDPELQLAITGPAVYKYESWNYWSVSSAAANGGAAVGVNFTGSVDPSNNQYWGGYVAASGIWLAGATTGALFGTPGIVITYSFATPAYFSGVLGVLSGGTFGLFWSQDTSSTNATILDVGSYIAITRIS